MMGDAKARTGRAGSVLMTGFGPFPGVPVNATMHLLPELAQRAPRLFPGAGFSTGVLATEWLAAPLQLDRLLLATKPDLVLHFGVSQRARGFEIEFRARNACSALPDACGALPADGKFHQHGAEHLATSLPARHIVTRLRWRGIPAFLSRDAGAYLCNATLYHSLLRAGSAPGRRVGFIHIPAALARSGHEQRARVGACPLSWEQAIAGSLEVIATCLSRRAARPIALGHLGSAGGCVRG